MPEIFFLFAAIHCGRKKYFLPSIYRFFDKYLENFVFKEMCKKKGFFMFRKVQKPSHLFCKMVDRFCSFALSLINRGQAKYAVGIQPNSEHSSIHDFVHSENLTKKLSRLFWKPSGLCFCSFKILFTTLLVILSFDILVNPVSKMLSLTYLRIYKSH